MNRMNELGSAIQVVRIDEVRLGTNDPTQNCQLYIELPRGLIPLFMSGAILANLTDIAAGNGVSNENAKLLALDNTGSSVEYVGYGASIYPKLYEFDGASSLTIINTGRKLDAYREVFKDPSSVEYWLYDPVTELGDTGIFTDGWICKLKRPVYLICLYCPDFYAEY